MPNSRPFPKEEIQWVAEAADDQPEFARRAQEIANKCEASDVHLLASEYHTENTPPVAVKDKYRGLGQWLAARQFAIFEIYYFIGQPSLPELRRMANGEYDWIQGNALEILCRLAANDIEREEIIGELLELTPKLRYEAVAYMLQPLYFRAKSDEKIQHVLDELMVVPEFKEVFAELRE